MVERAAAFLHSLPLLCLFLSILIGTIIGRFHFKGVGLGSVVGTLIAGILIGILAKPELPEILRWSFFYLFLFSIGYSVGPQFFGSLKKEALPQIALALVVAFTGLATVVAVSAAFGFDEGIAVGILSGGMTQSAALGTGLSAIAELPIDAAEKVALAANAPLADAITYGFGDLGLILFLTWLGPMIMRADLRREAKVLEARLAGEARPADKSPVPQYGIRAYRVENPQVVGSTLASLEQRYVEARLSVQRVERGGEFLSIAPTLMLNQGDRVVVSAGRRALALAAEGIGPEADDAALLAVPVKTATAVVTNKAVHGLSLGQLGQEPAAHGVYLQSLQRGTELMPRESWTIVERGDMLHIVGAPNDLERAARHIG